MAKFCPNIHSKEFKELASVFNEEVATRIWVKNEGNHPEFDRSGKPSQLFKDLESHLGSRKEAIKYKSQIYTNSYINETNWIEAGEEPSAVMIPLEDVNITEDFQTDAKIEESIPLQEAKTWLEQRNIPFNLSRQVLETNTHIKLKGSQPIGMYLDGLVYLSLNTPVETAYHEAFHSVMDGFLSLEEKKEILNAAKELYKVDIDKNTNMIAGMTIDNYQNYFKDKQEDKFFELIETKPGIIKGYLKGQPLKAFETAAIIEELNNRVLEERLANAFEAYVKSSQIVLPLHKRIAKFFKELFYMITGYKKHQHTINKFFKDIEKGKVTKNGPITNIFSKEVTKSINDQFTTEQQKDIVNTITGKFAQILNNQELENINPRKILSDIRDMFLNSMFITTDKSKLSDEKAKELFDHIINGTTKGNIPKNVRPSIYLEELMSVYKNWYNKIGDNKFHNVEEYGWAHLAKKQLKSFGFIVRGDIVNNLEENAHEKDHTKAAVENDNKKSLSGKVKNFLSMIVEYDINGNEQKTFLNTPRFAPFAQTYQSVALTLVNTASFSDMLRSLEERGKVNPTLHYVHKQLMEKIKDPTPENLQFLASFYTNMKMTYISFIGAVEEIEYYEVDGQTKSRFKIKYFESNNNRLGKVIFKRWSSNATRPDNKGLITIDKIGNEIINQEKANIVNNAYEVIKEINSSDSELEPHHIEALVDFSNAIGIDMNEDIFLASLSKGILIEKELLKGTDLFLYLTKGSGDVLGIDSIVKGLKPKNNINPYKKYDSVIKRFIRVAENYESDHHGSFVNGSGKSIYPINMASSMTNIFTALKNYNKEGQDPFWKNFIDQYVEDQSFFPDNDIDHPHADVILSGIMAQITRRNIIEHDDFFTSQFENSDFDSYKRKNEDVSQASDYSLLTPVSTSLNRMNIFGNNSNKKGMRIFMPTLADRNKLVAVQLPRISHVKGLHQYGDKTINDMLEGMIRRDMTKITMVADSLRLEYNRNKVKGIDSEAGLVFEQVEWLNDTKVGQELIEFAKLPVSEKLEHRIEKMEELIPKALNELKKKIEEDLKSYKENKSKALAIKELDLNMIEDLYGGRGKAEINLFLRDFAYSNFIIKQSLKRIFAGNQSQYGSHEKFSKRWGSIASPGRERLQQDFLADFGIIYGSKPTYDMAVVDDLYIINDENLKFYEAVWGKKLTKPYREGNDGKGSIVTDAMGFTTIEKHMLDMQGEGLWGPEYDKAYKNYLRSGVFEYSENGKVYKPPLTPKKTYYDGMHLVNGKMVRIMVKHSTMPLLKQFTKNHPNFDKLRKAMEAQGIDEVNVISGVKAGSQEIRKFELDENGIITDESLEDLHKITLQSRFQRVPQAIPDNVYKDSSIGSQLMKLILTNVKDTNEYLINGQIKSGAELKDHYHDIMEKLVENGKSKFMKETGYDVYKEALDSKDPDKIYKASKEFVENLKNILSNSVDSRDLPDNYLKALDPIDTVDENGNKIVDFNVPLAFPAYQGKFEQILLSLVKNKVMNQTINGKALVQVAELGGHKFDGRLKFVHGEILTKTKSDLLQYNEGKKEEDFAKNKIVAYKKEGEKIATYYSINKIKGDSVELVKLEAAEVAIPYDLAEKMNLPKDKNGEFILDGNLPEDLREIVGYRIPTQGKSSMLPFRIKRVLPQGMGKAILVPADITTQMGSDFDIDKLFLMFPNYTLHFENSKGERWNEKSALISELKKKGININKKQASKLLQNSNYVEELEYDSIDLKDEVDTIKTKLAKKKKKLSLAKVEKVPYDLENLDSTDRESLENAFLDIVRSILTNVAHGEEMLTSIDSPTIPSFVKYLKEKIPSQIELDGSSLITEEELEMRNKVGKSGIAIHAVGLNGQAIKQEGSVKLTSRYKVKFDGFEYDSLSKITDKNKTLIAQHYNKLLNIAVDNANDPLMDFINDNAFTNPVMEIILETGHSNSNVYEKKYSNLNGDALEIAMLFLNQPIIKRLTEEYINKEYNPSKLYELILDQASKLKINKKVFAGLVSDVSPISTQNIKTEDLRKAIGKNPADFKELQVKVLINFYLYHKAGRMNAALTKILNADRVKFPTIADLEVDEQTLKELESNRNDTIKNFKSLLDGTDYKNVKTFREVLDLAREFSDVFFPFRKDALSGSKQKVNDPGIKELIRKEMNKNKLTKEHLNAINKDSLLFFYGNPNSNSPIAELFSDHYINTFFKGDDSMDIRVSKYKTAIEESKEGTILFDLKDNSFLNRLSPHPDNIKMVELNNDQKRPMYEINTLAFDYGYNVDIYEQNKIIDDFRNLYNHDSPEIAAFAKDLIYYQILSKGFETGPDSFADVIPVEVWSDPALSTKENNSLSLLEFFRKNYNEFNNKDYFSGYLDEFITNNTHLKSFIPTISTKTSVKKDGAIILYREHYSAYSYEHGFARYIKKYNRKFKRVDIYKRIGSGNYKNEDEIYRKIELKSVPYKLKTYNTDSKNDNIQVYEYDATSDKMAELTTRKKCKDGM